MTENSTFLQVFVLGVFSVRTKVERTTLGELDAFSQLKQQLKETDAASTEEPVKKEEPKGEATAEPVNEEASAEAEVAATEESTPPE